MEERINLIKQIEEVQKSRVICYITSDRPAPLNAQISGDVTPWFYRQLKDIGHTKRIDLFVYSSGGDTITPWRLVCLIREFCDELGVIIPYKSHSAATLLALGADEILMGPLGELSPIDPLISTPFNPSPSNQPNMSPPPISVEDVIGYINLAKGKERFHLSKQDNLLKVFEKLSDKVHPLALGATHRSHTLIRLLAENLLKQCRKEKYKPEEIEKIIKTLAEKLYYHNYLISRNEAFTLGLKIKHPDKKMEDLIWDLYLKYGTHMGLTMQFSPYEYFTDNTVNSIDKEFPIGIIETAKMTIEGKNKFRFIKTPQPPAIPIPQIQLQGLGFKWGITRPKEEENAEHKVST